MNRLVERRLPDAFRQSAGTLGASALALDARVQIECMALVADAAEN